MVFIIFVAHLKNSNGIFIFSNLFNRRWPIYMCVMTSLENYHRFMIAGVSVQLIKFGFFCCFFCFTSSLFEANI